MFFQICVCRLQKAISVDGFCVFIMSQNGKISLLFLPLISNDFSKKIKNRLQKSEKTLKCPILGSSMSDLGQLFFVCLQTNLKNCKKYQIDNVTELHFFIR